MPVRPALLPAVLALGLLLPGCVSVTAGNSAPAVGASGPGGPSGRDVELVRGDACAEVFFWAASDDGEVVVTVSADLADRPAAGPSESTYELPDPEVTVTVLTGPGDLTQDLCTDVLVGPEPTGRQEAVAGTVHLTVDPPGEACGSSDGRLRIGGLVAEDGTAFAPVDVSSVLVGCNVGG
ncbi:hypothetical protein [Blastococcus sp. URHD0036]|uniref:hypothetical protein n=1 Tax=Blastococcus sp. URHD0036 TaxID=1380356 RepID=UPI000495684F|nr:hypothetical protein [Blastococcus sp. URHD0036]